MAGLDACLEQALFKRIPFVSCVKTHREVCAIAGREFGTVD